MKLILQIHLKQNLVVKTKIRPSKNVKQKKSQI